MKNLILYTTSACHLCEQAQSLIQPLLATYNLNLSLIDIADSDELMAQYGIKIPVVSLEGEETDLDWPFDQQIFLSYIENGN